MGGGSVVEGAADSASNGNYGQAAFRGISSALGVYIFIKTSVIPSRIRAPSINDGQAHIEVRFQNETLWLSQAQMAQLFDKDSDTISLHLKNIYKSKELEASLTTEESSVVRQEGKRQVRRKIKFYNLDAIISVGYRVNSIKGTQFLIWATQRLKDYLTQGYAIDQSHFDQNAAKLKQALALIEKAATSPELTTDAGRAKTN